MKIQLLGTCLLCAGLTMGSPPQGNLFIIGGGARPDYMVEKIIALAGGTSARILIIPNASSDPVGTAEYQLAQYREKGVENVGYVNLTAASVDHDTNLARLEGVTGIFFSGGDQSRLTDIMTGSRFLARIHTIYQEGGVIGGTSAGAAVMSAVMITGDELISRDTVQAFNSIQPANIATVAGFGFITAGIIDQHFVHRKRHNRLLSLILEQPELIGIGIDESTAIWVKPDNTFEVVGESVVIVYDARRAVIQRQERPPFRARDITMHILGSGDRYNLEHYRILK